ncbi:MAG: hypothetical protein JWM19_6350 [Actinomycetia bacterium]|nr:hypothetical protein [Actinomycetes bacterium]
MFKAFAGSENKASGKTPATDGSAPRPVLRASKLMLFGAAGTIVYGIWAVIPALTNKSALIKYYESVDHLTASKANSGFVGTTIVDILLWLAAAAVWWWMARATRAGFGQARLASSVLFLAWTYWTYQSAPAANTVLGLINLIITLIIWGIGGVAIYQLWLPESTLFIRSAAKSR